MVLAKRQQNEAYVEVQKLQFFKCPLKLQNSPHVNMSNLTAEIHVYSQLQRTVLVSIAKLTLHDNCTGGELLYNSPVYIKA